MELKYQNELTAHVKLSSLYKVNNDNNNNNNNRLLSSLFQGEKMQLNISLCIEYTYYSVSIVYIQVFFFVLFVGSSVRLGDQESRA